MDMNEIQLKLKDVIDFIESCDAEIHAIDDKTKLLLDRFAMHVAGSLDKKNILVTLILSKMCDRSLESQRQIEMVKTIFMYMDIRLSELEGSGEVIRRCIYVNNIPLVEMLIKEGYKFKGDGNIVRQAVYSNKLEMAQVFINAGYKAPDSLTLFSISNQLSWDPVRLSFLLGSGTTLSISDKEMGCIDIIKSYMSDTSHSKQDYESFVLALRENKLKMFDEYGNVRPLITPTKTISEAARDSDGR